ncbi:hypothetical protein [Paraburkholderia sp. SIMBA_054]|uniref:hypothetical protein n=1 Tax=Paraburkholderia sp. SIMBA_054 TaxID=3085795 RepID=UPI003979F9EC
MTGETDKAYPLEPGDWEGAAQDAAFDGRCFARLVDGQMINAQALDKRCVHSSPFAGQLTRGSPRDTLTAAALERLSRIPPPGAQSPGLVSGVPSVVSPASAQQPIALNDGPMDAVA